MKNNNKLCAKCQEEKTPEEFYRSSKASDGLFSYCKDCAKNYEKNNYKKNSTQRIEKIKKWQQQNKEKTKEYKKKYNRRAKNVA